MVTKAVHRREASIHNGERGNKVTPSHRHNPTTNSGPGMAKPRQALGIALSQPLLVPEQSQLLLPDIGHLSGKYHAWSTTMEPAQQNVRSKYKEVVQGCIVFIASA